jgi:hypothetical protein
MLRAMSRGAIITVRVLTVAMLVGLGYLFFAGRKLNFAGDNGFAVRCSPTYYYLDIKYDTSDATDTTSSYRPTYTVTSGELPKTDSLTATNARIDGACDRARQSSVALLAVLAVPTSVLAVLSLRRPPEED